MTVRYYVMLVAFRAFFDLYRPCMYHQQEKSTKHYLERAVFIRHGNFSCEI